MLTVAERLKYKQWIAVGVLYVIERVIEGMTLFCTGMTMKKNGIGKAVFCLYRYT